MSESLLSQLNHILSSNRHNVTKARKDTFNLLLGSEPQSMNELLAKAEGQVDKVSVYRNIALFEKLGIVHRIYIGWKYKLELSDKFISHHHHLSCLKCGKVIDIKDEMHVNEFIHEIANKYSFQPRQHQFEIDGYCHNCSIE